MIPARFVVEYPKRCLELIEALEPIARRRDVVGSFSLLVASAVFVIPYERMGPKSPLHAPARDSDLSTALKSLEKVSFIEAPLWKGHPPEGWRFSRIMNEPNDTTGWKDEQGLHPMDAAAKNSLQACKAEKVLRVIRNALSHATLFI